MNRKRDLENLGLLYENNFVKEENDSYQPGIVQKNQEREDENPIINYEDEQELKKGDRVTFLNVKPDLKSIKSGSTQFPAPKFTRGEIIHVQDGVAFVDQGIGIHVVPIEDLKREEEEYENPETGEAGSNYDAGPNQQDMGWSSEAEKGGEQTPSAEVTGLNTKTPLGPSAERGGQIDTAGDNPNEEEDEFNMDPYYNREEDLRGRGIDPDAEDPDADEKRYDDDEEDEKFPEPDLIPLPYGSVNKDKMPEPDLIPLPKGSKVGDEEDEEMSLQKALEVIKQHMNSKNKYGDDYDIEDETLNFGDREKAMKVYIKNFNKKIKKESYSSHGDRDMSLLAENYLNIKNHE